MRRIAITAVALAACRFSADEEATRFRCDDSSGCPAGLVCTAGWCEAGAAQLADAAPLPDAVDFTCPCSLWDDDTVPDRLENNDGQSIEVAVKLRVDVPGRLVALRFYKPPLSQGIHVGRVWSRAGALLAEAEYRDESESGWQEVALDRPVAVQPNTTFIASVYIESGYYAADVEYFLAAHDRAPLHALADEVDGGNGIFRLGQGFPDLATYMASNYWVDVVFEED